MQQAATGWVQTFYCCIKSHVVHPVPGEPSQCPGTAFGMNTYSNNDDSTTGETVGKYSLDKNSFPATDHDNGSG